MAKPHKLQHLLDEARIAPEIFKLWPDYRALLVVVDGIPPGPSDEASEAMLKDAETFAREALAKQPVTELPHIAAWREAYKKFGAKPNKTRNSLEALTRRVEAGLPRINRLTDIYNAISVKHQIPFGGEDLEKYSGAPFLVQATGKEKFEVKSGGGTVTEHPDVGEVVWCDGEGVTCRRWNWRQGPRTALDDQSSKVLFILDALKPCTDEQLAAAADELATALEKLSPDVSVSRRLMGAGEVSS